MAALHDRESIASLPGDGEPPSPSTANRHRGGWTTVPFVIGLLSTLAPNTHTQNLLVFNFPNMQKC